MLKPMDERQMKIHGEIAIQTLIFVVALLLGISFLDSFGIVRFMDYVDLSDITFILCMIILTFVSLRLIWKGAYFGLVNTANMKLIVYTLTVSSIVLDVSFIRALARADVMILSVLTMLMYNSIAISLWIKRKDWK